MVARDKNYFLFFVVRMLKARTFVILMHSFSKTSASLILLWRLSLRSDNHTFDSFADLRA